MQQRQNIFCSSTSHINMKPESQAREQTLDFLTSSRSSTMNALSVKYNLFKFILYLFSKSNNGCLQTHVTLMSLKYMYIQNEINSNKN